MLITVSMLMESLKDLEFSEIHIKKRDKISSIRILTEQQTMQNEILYLSKNPDDETTICRTAAGTSFCVLTDLISLLNQIMGIFDHYDRWQRQLQRAIENGCTLTELLNLSYPVIAHPLAILDGNEWEIAHSDYFSDEMFDLDWTDMIQKHTSNTQKIADFNQKYYKYFNLKQVYHIPGNIFGQGYAVNLFHNHTFCGVMILAEPDKLEKATQGELDAMQYLSELICDMISINSYDTDMQFPEKPFFEYLGKEDQESLEKLERALEIASWEKTDPKWILYAEAVKSGRLAPMPSHSKLMFNRIEGIVTVEYKIGIAFLCNLRILKGKDHAKDMLSKYLNQIGYYAGTSSEFHDLSYMKKMLDQAQISLEEGIHQSGNIHIFEDALLPYIISILKKEDAGLLEHPCLKLLKNYDKRFGNQLYETLFVYLKNERKLSNTLCDLNIPRSTLLNRLQRIDELLDLSLDQPEVRFHILLSYFLYY